jgi:hypothetical protein
MPYRIAAPAAAILLAGACSPQAASPEEPVNAPETVPTPSGVPGAERLPAPEPPRDDAAQNAVEK